MIIANSNEGKSIQLITKDGAHFIEDVNSIVLNDDQTFSFNVMQKDITIRGHITMGELHPLKRKVMGPFTYIPFMECKHDIYSMYHTLNGELTIDTETINFDEGIGYIEGDKGVNFPSKYVWYNSTTEAGTITFAIANIPFGLFSFTGVLGFIKTKEKEYYLSTYNFVKVKDHSQNRVVLKKGKYKLEVNIAFKEGEKLKAPVKGDMTRYIKENVALSSHYTLSYKNKDILSMDDDNSSYEWVW